MGIDKKTKMNQRTIWLLSPYHTGSHKAWAGGYLRHSRHRVVLLTMAGRFWKWRMQGGAIEMAAQAQRQLAQEPPPDAILATDMLNLPAWLGLLRASLPSRLPVILYMHENQLTYPWRPGEAPDLTYGMINWLSQLAADRVLFNSRFHLESWFNEVPKLLKHFPDYNHLSQIDEVIQRSNVLPVGIDCPKEKTSHQSPREPLILWNQRWEYDKRPDRFFDLLYRLHEDGYPFNLAVAGENFRNAPQEFEEARRRLADRVVHWGYVPDQEAYRHLLSKADLVISTTDHEFFGVSVLEAMAAGAFPLLPNRLSYPELIPPQLHPACIYADESDLYSKAAHRLTHPRPAPPLLYEYIRLHYDWPLVANAYDTFLEECIQRTQSYSSSRR
jgi:glycosyltransferase involved in cell wall biosynthesis